MTDDEQPDDEWSRIWCARVAVLTSLLGPPTDSVFHATIPFEFREHGGAADVLLFPNYNAGATYVTAELTGADVGQKPNSLGHYELMICTTVECDTAANLIARLACYTCDEVLEARQTMDIGEFFGDSTLRAMVFSHPGEAPVRFDLFDQECSLLLCIGITQDELAFARKRGSDELLALLKQHGVFPYTIPDRPSVQLPNGRSAHRKKP